MDRLAGAVGEDDVVGRDVDVTVARQLVCHELSQGPVSLVVGVDGEVFALVRERLLETLDKSVERDGLGVRVGDGEVVLSTLRGRDSRTALWRVLREQSLEAELGVIGHQGSSW